MPLGNGKSGPQYTHSAEMMTPPKRIPEQSRIEMRTELERTRIALNGIKVNPETNRKRIVPRIHRLSFSLSQQLLTRRLGGLGRVDNPRPRMARSYPKVAYYWLGKTRVSIFFPQYEPNEYLKPCILELTYKSQKDLIALCEKLPELRVRSVEYAIDFFCQNPQSVSNLFTILVRYMYFRNVKKAEFKGGSFDGWREEREENAALKVGKSKIYERGFDRKGKLKGDEDNPDLKYWKMVDVNRVRLEFTVDRKHAGKSKLQTIKEFIQDPGFSKRIPQKIMFRIFHGSEILPTDGAEYYVENRYGRVIVFECFQQAYLYWKRRIRNISQYVKPALYLEEFRKEIVHAIALFGKKWAKRNRKYMQEGSICM